MDYYKIMNVLICDPDDASGQFLKMRVADLGYTPVLETVREGALKRLTEAHFTIILMDPAPSVDIGQIARQIESHASTACTRS